MSTSTADNALPLPAEPAAPCVPSCAAEQELGKQLDATSSAPAPVPVPAPKHSDSREKPSKAVEKAAPVSAAKAPRLDALDAPRWLASCMIVAYHRYTDELGVFAEWGSAWTQFFFVLSGFVLAYVEMARPAEKSPKLSQLQYLRKRLVTVYPTYMFALLCRGLQWGWGLTWFSWTVLPLNVIMVQAWFPICDPSSSSTDCSPQSWNGVAWFMSVLVIYWLLLRSLVRWMRGFSLRKAYSVATLLWLWSFVLLPTAVVEPWGICTGYCYRVLWAAVQGGPLGYMHVFACGVAAARIFVLSAMCDARTGAKPTESTKKLALDVERAPFVLRYGVCFGYTTYALLVAFVPYSAGYIIFHNGGILPMMLLVLLGGAIGVDPITKYVFRNPVLIVCGRISFNQYLLQDTVWDFLDEHMPPDQALLRKCIYPVVLVAAAYVSERFVTSPYTEWQRMRQEKGIKGADDWLIERADNMLGAAQKCLGRFPCIGCCSRRAEADDNATNMTLV